MGKGLLMVRGPGSMTEQGRVLGPPVPPHILPGSYLPHQEAEMPEQLSLIPEQKEIKCWEKTRRVAGRGATTLGSHSASSPLSLCSSSVNWK